MCDFLSHSLPLSPSPLLVRSLAPSSDRFLQRACAVFASLRVCVSVYLCVCVSMSLRLWISVSLIFLVSLSQQQTKRTKKAKKPLDLTNRNKLKKGIPWIKLDRRHSNILSAQIYTAYTVCDSTRQSHLIICKISVWYVYRKHMCLIGIHIRIFVFKFRHPFLSSSIFFLTTSLFYTRSKENWKT